MTPLQKEINGVIGMALVIVIYLEILLVGNAVLKELGVGETVGQATLLVGLVPNGLFVSIAIAYAVGAVRILRHGALVQQSNAIESLSRVDVLCTDKTGTLTTNRMHLVEVVPLGEVDETVARALHGLLVTSQRSPNRTSDAIAAACPAEPVSPLVEVDFSSGRKWSAAAFAAGSDRPPGGGLARNRAVPVVAVDGIDRALLTVGIPSVLLAIWAQPGRRVREPLGRLVLRFVAPAAMTTSFVGIGVLFGYLVPALAAETPQGADQATIDAVYDRLLPIAQSALAIFLVLSGTTLIVFAEPPIDAMAVVRPRTSDRRPTILAVLLFLGLWFVIGIVVLRDALDLEPIGLRGLVVVLAGWLAWFATLWLTWRMRLIEHPPGGGDLSRA